MKIIMLIVYMFGSGFLFGQLMDLSDHMDAYNKKNIEYQKYFMGDK